MIPAACIWHTEVCSLSGHRCIGSSSSPRFLWWSRA